MIKTSAGKLRYSPESREKPISKWWLILDCDPELAKYYRKLYQMYTYNIYKLQRPSWEAHITVVRDEEPPNKEWWMKYQGLNVEFHHDFKFYGNETFVWLPIKSNFLLDIRQELGLSRNPELPLHLTIGNNKNI